MSAIPKVLLTPQEYLARERKSDFKSEYCRGEAFAMAGATFEHTLIKDNIARESGNQLKEGACRVLTSDMRVHIPVSGLYAYPDIVFVFDQPRFEDDQLDTLLNPRVIVEVLSDSTEKYDRGFRFRNYRQIPSLREYVLVAQDAPVVERYIRQPDDNWLLTTTSGIEQRFEFNSVPARLAMSEIYRGIVFPDPKIPSADTRR